MNGWILLSIWGSSTDIFYSKKNVERLIFSFNFDKPCLILNKLLHFLVLIQNRFIPGGTVAELELGAVEAPYFAVDLIFV